PDFSDVEDDETTPIPTVDQLLAYMNLWARPHGYAVNKTQARMKKKGDGYRRYTFFCDRYGSPRPSKAKPRNTSSRKCGCLFKLNAYEKEPGVWNIKNHED
ncbi:hypothetical protein QBC36DRAFT_173623, partial [Triangularia setosa]